MVREFNNIPVDLIPIIISIPTNLAPYVPFPWDSHGTHGNAHNVLTSSADTRKNRNWDEKKNWTSVA